MKTSLRSLIVLIMSVLISSSVASQENLIPITPDNATQVSLLHSIGGGSIMSAAWSMDGNYYAVGGSSGVAVYQFERPDSLKYKLQGHSGVVTSVAFSPDTSLLATASEDTTIKLWDSETGAEIQTLEGHTSWVTDVAFSPDGTQISSAGVDGLRIWDVVSGQEVNNMLSDGGFGPENLAYSPDGSLIATAHRGSQIVHIWDSASGTMLATFRNRRPIITIAFHPDGQQIAYGDFAGDVFIANINTQEIIHELHGYSGAGFSPINAIDFSPDGDELAVAGSDRSVRVWDVMRGGLIAEEISHSGAVMTVAYDPTGSFLLSGGFEGDLLLWNTASWGYTLLQDTQGGPVVDVAFDPTRNLMTAASRDGKLRVWDAATGSLEFQLPGHAGEILAVAFSQDGSLLASISGYGGDSTLRIWDMVSRTQRNSFEAQPVNATSLAFHPSGEYIAYADDAVIILNLENGEIFHTLSPETNVEGIRFSHDGTMIAAAMAAPSNIKVWDFQTGDLIASLEGHYSFVTDLDFSPDDRFLASASFDGTVRIWDLHTQEMVSLLEGHISAVSDVDYHPSGDLVASSSMDNTVRIWDVASGTLLSTLEGHTDFVESVAFNGDGTLLVSGGKDGVVKVWGVLSDE